MDHIADAGGVTLSAIIAIGIHDFLINIRTYGFVFNINMVCCSVQTAQSALRGVYQIVAKLQAGKRHGSVGCDRRTIIGNWSGRTLCKSQSGSSKSFCGILRISIFRNDIAASDDIEIVLKSGIIGQTSPLAAQFIGVVSARIALQIKNAINSIGFILGCIGNSNRAVVAGASCCILCRKRRHRHGAQQGNSQQSRHEFFERLFHRL